MEEWQAEWRSSKNSKYLRRIDDGLHQSEHIGSTAHSQEIEYIS
jgi:hypothetical protein